MKYTHRLPSFGLAAVAAAALAYVIQRVSEHTIEVVQARHLLPQWDPATHMGHGWVDYHLLVTGRIPQLIWDLWLQGIWPPFYSIYQVPFYLVLGGSISSAMWSGLVAFFLAGMLGAGVLWRQWGYRALLPASVFLALLMSSPFLLAFATVTMTETLGAAVQLLVVLCYVRYLQSPSPGTARLFAVSLSVLFFTKYNYFLMLAVPLVLHEWLERTPGWPIARRLTTIGNWGRRVLTSPAGMIVAVYLVALLIILRTGGFETQLLGQRISVHGVGNSGHVVLYFLLWRLWRSYRRGEIDWARLAAADLRVRPLLLWFAAPVTIWLASPYPNHLRDFANLVINRPLGDATLTAGVSTYFDSLRTSYFYSEWVLLFVVVAFVVAAIRYRRQVSWMKWLILAIPMQFAAIVFHQTRIPRFLLLTVVLLCLVAAAEAGRWLAGSGRGRLLSGLLAPVVLAVGMFAATNLLSDQRFRRIAFDPYIDSEALRSALVSIRADLTGDDRLAIVGQNSDLSPGLFRWELGPPSGVATFPSELAGSRRLDLSQATRVLLLVPVGPGISPLDPYSDYLQQRGAVLERVARGEFTLDRDIPVPDMQVTFRLYKRPTTSSRQ